MKKNTVRQLDRNLIVFLVYLKFIFFVPFERLNFIQISMADSSQHNSQIASEIQSPVSYFLPAELILLRAMHIKNLIPVQTESALKFNPFLENERVTAFGRELFFTKALSKYKNVACSDCHNPKRQWGEIASSQTMRRFREPPALGASVYFRFLNWDGSKDSLFAQSIAPIINASEHHLDRKSVKQIVAQSEKWSAYFSHMKDKVTQGVCYKKIGEPHSGRLGRLCSLDELDAVGLALEAFLTKLRLGPTRLDTFIESLDESKDKPQKNLKRASIDDVFSLLEQQGLKIFLGKGQCVRCHHGPLLSDQDFHSTGTPLVSLDEDERGRYMGAMQLLQDNDNCLKRPALTNFSDDCPELTYLATNRLAQIGSYRTPSLRNVALTAPYFHGGQMKTLEDVVTHYSNAVPRSMGESAIFILNLSTEERNALTAFLGTLDSQTLMLKP